MGLADDAILHIGITQKWKNNFNICGIIKLLILYLKYIFMEIKDLCSLIKGKTMLKSWVSCFHFVWHHQAVEGSIFCTFSKAERPSSWRGQGRIENRLLSGVFRNLYNLILYPFCYKIATNPFVCTGCSHVFRHRTTAPNVCGCSPLCDWWRQPADLLESENTSIKG